MKHNPEDFGKKLCNVANLDYYSTMDIEGAMDKFLNWASIIERVNTTKIEPLINPSDLYNFSTIAPKEAIVENGTEGISSPAGERFLKGFFVVPKTV